MLHPFCVILHHFHCAHHYVQNTSLWEPGEITVSRVEPEAVVESCNTKETKCIRKGIYLGSVSVSFPAHTPGENATVKTLLNPPSLETRNLYLLQGEA